MLCRDTWCDGGRRGATVLLLLLVVVDGLCRWLRASSVCAGLSVCQRRGHEVTVSRPPQSQDHSQSLLVTSQRTRLAPYRHRSPHPHQVRRSAPSLLLRTRFVEPSNALNSSVLKKIKGSPYSITERRVPELIPVLGRQPAGDVSHKPGGRLPLLSASYPRNP